MEINGHRVVFTPFCLTPRRGGAARGGGHDRPARYSPMVPQTLPWSTQHDPAFLLITSRGIIPQSEAWSSPTTKKRNLAVEIMLQWAIAQRQHPHRAPRCPGRHRGTLTNLPGHPHELNDDGSQLQPRWHPKDGGWGTTIYHVLRWANVATPIEQRTTSRYTGDPDADTFSHGTRRSSSFLRAWPMAAGFFVRWSRREGHGHPL
jgi:hypothetical protein